MPTLKSARKIAIIGFAGSGKSTLATQLGNSLGIEVFRMAEIMWGPNWVRLTNSEWKDNINKIIQKDSWIIDGKASRNVRGIVYDIEFPKADLIIFLDLPKSLCLWRIFKRATQYTGKHKPELSFQYPQSFRGFLSQMKRSWRNFDEDRLFNLRKLQKYSEKTLILKDSQDIVNFLAKVNGVPLESSF